MVHSCITLLFCIDSNECEDEDICGPYGECVDLPIRYYCNCQTGFYFYEETGQCESELCMHTKYIEFFYPYIMISDTL